MEKDEFYQMAARIIKCGRVSSVNTAERTVKVFFEDRDGKVSGDFRVLQHHKAHLIIQPDGQHSDGDGGMIADHDHSSKPLGGSEPYSYLEYWMPEVGQMVLCIILPARNGHGFVLGAV